MTRFILPATGSIARERGFQHFEVVVFEDQCIGGSCRRHAGRTRIAERQRAGTGFDEQCIRVAVITAFELDDAGAPRVTAREPDRAHGRFRARTHETHLLEPRYAAAQEFGEFDLAGGGRAETQAQRDRLLHGRDDRRMRVAEYQWTPRAYIVNIRLAVDVPRVSAAATGEKSRRAADRAKCADRRIDAAGNHPLGGSEQIVVARGHAVWIWNN
jgi:hypothetical protein